MLSFFAWTASVLYGLEAIMGKLTSKHTIPDPLFFNFYWSLLILALTAPVALWYGITFPAHWSALIAASIFYALGGVFYILALYRLDASVIAPLFSFRSAISALLGALVLGEILSVHQYLLIAVIFLFGMFVGMDERLSVRSFFTIGAAWLILDCFALSFMAVFVKLSVGEIGFWNTTFWMALLGQTWLIGTVPLFKTAHRDVTRRQVGAVFVIALAGTVATVAANAAYAINVSIATAIISVPVSMFVAIAFAFFKPRLLEQHTTKVYAIRLVSAAFMFAAALQLS